MWRTGLLLSCWVLLSCSLGGSRQGPNILLITIDTLREDRLGCYGDPLARTPHLDRLAREGILLSSAQTAVPVTLPSHTTLFTGLYPASHAARYNGLTVSSEPGTLAEALREKGYETAGFVASLVLSHSHGIARGFDVYEDEWEPEEAKDLVFNAWQRDGERVASHFLQWFSEREESRPFFAWVHLYDPHTPYAPPPLLEKVARGDAYRGEVIDADRQVGRILAALEAGGLTEETIIVFLADHGEGLGEHGEVEHGIVLFETTLAVPWIFRIPGGPRGRIVDVPAETVDFFPTLADLVGLEKDPEWHGRSLAPFLAEQYEEETGDERVRYSESYFGYYAYTSAPIWSLRKGRWKLVQGKRTELFDLSLDPLEVNDLAREEPERADSLAKELERIRAGQKVPEPEELPDLTEDEENLLLALGYVAPKSEEERSGYSMDDLDPRDLLRLHENVHEGLRLINHEDDPEGATKLFRETISLRPDFIEAWYWLAYCLNSAGRHEEEEAAYRTVLSLKSSHSLAWEHLGVLRQEAGDWEEALECFSKAIQHDSVFAEAYANRGNLLMAMGEPSKARPDLATALRIDPESVIAHHAMGIYLKNRGDLEGAVRHFKLALRYDPSFPASREVLQALEYRYRRARGR